MVSSVWQHLKRGPLKVCVVGSGNWGTVVAKIVAINVTNSYIFQKTVSMYVYEETFEGRKLTDVINKEHENRKYLPGVKLPHNLVAVPDVVKAAAGAEVLIFVLPHQFIPPVCRQLIGKISPNTKAISLCKGLDCKDGKVNLITEYLRATLKIDISVLSGANVAEDVAKEQFSETTIGYRNLENAALFQQLFDTPYFRVNAIPDVAGVELCGALKNVVALAAGFCDGLKYGTNTKAAIIRLGLMEMKEFAHTFFKGIIDETFWDSSGVADLITTCFGGRNRRCAEYFARTRQSWQEIETKLLKGQKLQGTLTAIDVHNLLVAQKMTDRFPLFTIVYNICYENVDPSMVVRVFMSDTPRTILRPEDATKVHFKKTIVEDAPLLRSNL